jgi:peptide deformylase
MAVRSILVYPDKRLRTRSEPVTSVTPDIVALVEDMKETMYAAPGCGLAAPQVGVFLRIFIVDTAADDEPSQLKVFINPEIVSAEGKVTWEEGCLSFPGVNEEIDRAKTVTIRALDERGGAVQMKAEGLLAVAVQHENDHLEGVLMIDHMGALRRRLALRKLQKRAVQAEL